MSSYQFNLQVDVDVTSGTVESLLLSVFGLYFSMLVFWRVKYHRNKVAMIRIYHISATESSANGLTNLAMVKITMIIFAVWCIVELAFREVS